MKPSLIPLLIAAALSLPAAAAEPDEEMRMAASLMAGMEVELQKDSKKGFCDAVHDSPAYRGYLTRACEAGVKAKQKIADDCSPGNIAVELSADREKCMAMSPQEFAQRKREFGEGKAQFVKDMAARGIDGEKLLAEERAKLR